MKKSRRKLLGILLAMSIIMATVFPMQGTAAEGIDRAVKSEEQKEEKNVPKKMPETTVSANILPATERNDFSITPFAYDINQPVIESFEFEENGQILTRDDTLHFKMSAYDADSGIESATVIIRRKNTYADQRVTLEKGEGNWYTAMFSNSDFTYYTGDYYIHQIKVRDRSGNHVDWPVMENGEPLYTYTIAQDEYDKEKPVIKSITVDKNGQMVKAGEQVTITVKVEEENPESLMYVRFDPPTVGTSYASSYLELDESTMEYTGYITISSSTKPTTWSLTYLSVSDIYGNISYLSDFKSNGNTTKSWYYKVDPKGYVVLYPNDLTAPVIESITIDKNGQWVYPGDTVTITIKVDEEHPSSMARSYFYPQASNASVYDCILLYYNADTKEYKGTISITDKTYPCEWMLTEVYVYDLAGHSSSLYDFKPDSGKSYQWYYRVKVNGTYREDMTDATFSVHGLMRQEDGSYQYAPFIENKMIKVGRRDSLEGLGICPPLPAEGLHMKFREKKFGQEIDGNTELFFGNTANPSYDFYAEYDKSCVNVVLTYVSKDNGTKVAVMPQFVDKEATYGDVLASFVPPEDADQNFLTEYQLTDRDAAAQVEDAGYVGIEAKYDNCLVSWHIKYLDENGNEASKVISRTYKKGTAISDALASLEGQPAPGGLEFERWVLPGIDDGETLLHDMTNLNAAAVYKGKTTAEVSYTYRGESGKIASDTRLMALDGEGLSYNAALAMVKEALKELKHLENLELADWVNTTSGTDMAGYKKMNIQAQYANCVIILKYPQNIYEYVVVENGSEFTLPTENTEYMDIVWEGHDKGETVTITKDKEFLAADAKRKDETAEEPSSGKLSEEEINKIVADISQGGGGETIHVDMRKATVVPKEILEAIKGKDIKILLDMGTYSWSIGGNKVTASELKDIDLEVIIGTKDIPPTIVDELAEGKPATQITLIHNGNFGFQANLTVNLGSEHSGCTGRLYYYDSAGKLIFQNAGEIGADGNISLSFSHASEYVVIIEKELADSGNENEGESEKDDESEEGDENKNEEKNGNSSGKEEGNKNAASGSGHGSSTPEIISISKTEANIVPNAEPAKDYNSREPKSPKTGE